MTDDELKTLVASLAVAQKATDAQLKETDAQLKATGRKLDKIAKLIGGISANQGDVAEAFFFNSLAGDTRLGSICFDDIEKNSHKRRGSIEEEYDIIMTNGEVVGIVEVKYKAHDHDLDRLDRKMRHFKQMFPWFKTYKQYGAIASFHIHDEAKESALQRGYFVLQRSGNVLHTEQGKTLQVM